MISSQIFINRQQPRSQKPTSQSIVEDFLSDSIKIGLRKITIGEIVDLIRKNPVYTNGISYRHWRDFIGCERELDQLIFVAFCHALDINNSEDFVEKSLIYSKPSTREFYLIEHLNSFNHRKQIRIINNQLSIENQVRAFLFVNPCPYRTTWILRRIEHEIKEMYRQVEVKRLNKDKSLQLLSIQDLKYAFQQYDSKYFIKKNLILVLNIDSYDLQSLENIINNCWLPLLRIFSKERTGIVLLFLVAHGLGNDWQIEWQNSSILATNIVKLCSYPFKSEDFCEVISKIARDFALQFREYSLQPAETIAEQLLADSNGNVRELLRKVYNHFNCRISQEEFNRQWQNYPPS
jgi:hypothetical protein